MNSKGELLPLFEKYALHELDNSYYRLRILSSKDSIDYAKKVGLRLLEKKDSFPIAVVKNDRLAALAIVVHKEEDSNIFKKRIGSIEFLTIDRTLPSLERKMLISQLLHECHKNWQISFDMITTLIDFDQYDLLEAFQEIGAKVYGGNYTWVCQLSKINEANLSDKLLEKVFFYQPEEKELLIEYVKQSYSTYRSHYHADSHFEENISSEVYSAYIKEHLANNGQVLVIKKNEDIIAFSTINPHQEINRHFNKNLVAEIAYSGVSPSARGSRAYELTLIKGLELFKKQDFSYVVFGCSADNYVVQSIWIKLGDFRPRRFCYRFHWWL
ncbi:MAG: hypothetical protein AABY84_05475 [Candidatus Firestonebacteria bacterium]